MSMARTNSQKMARAAYDGIAGRMSRLGEGDRDRYASFARSFPSLVHACGLAQAVAFAQAKGGEGKDGREAKPEGQYLDDLAAVLRAIGHAEAESADGLARATREHAVPVYVRLSRNALQAAGWLKRYVEAGTQE